MIYPLSLFKKNILFHYLKIIIVQSSYIYEHNKYLLYNNIVVIIKITICLALTLTKEYMFYTIYNILFQN